MSTSDGPAYDALLVVSFGGPEKRDDVIPFLENVLRGKNVPRQRILEVAQHYDHFDGVSPLDQQVRDLIAMLEAELAAHGPQLPVYWGNRNWHPLLADTLGQMAADGIRQALAFVTSAYSSYPGCRLYRENIEQARARVGAAAPRVDKLRTFFNHPGFIEPMVERVGVALGQIPNEDPSGRRRGETALIYTAHSLPLWMAQGCEYQSQLAESCRLVSAGVGRDDWRLVYQSRSGPPSQPWLEPDVCDDLRRLARQGIRDVVVVPIGFVCEHMETVYDLDTLAAQLCRELGINMVRAGTALTHPKFVSMIRELMLERIEPGSPRRALGNLGPSHDQCPADCCPPPVAASGGSRAG